MKRKILVAMFIFSIIALVASIMIQIENISQSKSLNQVCSATGSNCTAVQNSEYGTIFGIKMVHLGLLAFLVFNLIMLSQISNHKLTHKFKNKYVETMMILGAIIAGLSGICLICLQAFVLHQYCIYCLIIDMSSIIIMILAIGYIIVGTIERNKGQKHEYC